MGVIVTFGEIMMRLNPKGYLRFVQTKEFDVSFAGAEANVAASLACFGKKTRFISKLPAHEMGQSAINHLRQYGVDTSMIIRGGERIGVFFLEKGASQRPSKVIYDRADSAIAKAKRDDFDWDVIFEDAEWFHFTGITPALSEELVDICEDACKAAKKRGVKISFDINYRRSLWPRDMARKAIDKLLPYVDICITNEGQAADIYDIRSEFGEEIGYAGEEDLIGIARKIRERFGFEKIAFTQRRSASADDNDWSGMIFDGTNAYFTRRYSMHIVDRVGGGDGFGAGLIYALTSSYDDQHAIDFAVAASCLKHSMEQDFCLASVEEIESLAGGNVSGKVQR